MTTLSPKHRRIEAERELSPDDDDYVPYVPVAQRRQQKLAQFATRGQAQSAAILKSLREQEEREQQGDEEREEEKRRERLRKERTLLEEAQEVMKKKAVEGTNDSIDTHLVSGDINALCNYGQMARKQLPKKLKKMMLRFSLPLQTNASSLRTLSLRKESSTQTL